MQLRGAVCCCWRTQCLYFIRTQMAVVDGIGTALFSKMSFTNGVPDKSNFDSYRIICINEAPKEIEVHFVQYNIDPTGMGELAYPPIFAVLANALYKATGKGFSDQPFQTNIAKS